jgi:hypothetical protein
MSMKMTSALVKQTLSQIEAQPIPDNHPACPQLTRLFGDHTFFLDNNGLNIVEPSGRTETGSAVANVVRLASWADAKRENLKAHEPEPTDAVVELTSEDPDLAD